MTLNDTNLEFSSTWDIDQLTATGTVAVGAGTSVLYTLPNSTFINAFEVQFKPTGGLYFQAGTSSTNGTIAGLFTFSCYISAGAVQIVTPSAGTARYFIWADKVTY